TRGLLRATGRSRTRPQGRARGLHAEVFRSRRLSPDCHLIHSNNNCHVSHAYSPALSRVCAGLSRAKQSPPRSIVPCAKVVSALPRPQLAITPPHPLCLSVGKKASRLLGPIV